MQKSKRRNQEIESLIQESKTRLQDDTELRGYLLGRGASEDQLDKFCVGSISVGELQRKGIWVPDGIKGPLFTFPLYDLFGTPIGFQFREFGSKNIFGYKVSNFTFFGLTPETIESIFDKNYVVLVEGAFDLFPVQRSISNSLALLTANLSNEQETILRRLASLVVLFLDSDKTGREASEKLIEKTTRRLRFSSFGAYPKKDPGELWEHLGEEKFSEFVKDRVRRFKYYRLGN